MGYGTFKVVLSDISAIDLPQGKHSSLNPFIVVRWDTGFKEWKTAHVSGTCNPEFKDRWEFEYSTRYPDKISKKVVDFVVMTHKMLADAIVGMASMTLADAAGGPVSHSIPIRDKRGDPGGRLNFTLSFEHRPSTAKLNITNLGLGMPFDGNQVTTRMEIGLLGKFVTNLCSVLSLTIFLNP